MSSVLRNSPPSKEARITAYRQGSWAERQAVHDAIAAHKAPALHARRELGRRYLARHPGTPLVADNRAMAQLDLAQVGGEACAEALRMAEGRAAQHDSGSLQYPVLGSEYSEASAAAQLATSPTILAPIVHYLGMLPVLFNMFVTQAGATEFLPATAHMFHLDPEDVVSFKVLMHLGDVDADSGPFHALPADVTQTVLNAVDYRGSTGRISDETIDGLVGWKSVTRFLGPTGTAVLVDSTRCLHFGGRPREPGKPLRQMLVFQYLLPTSFLFPIDGDAKHPRYLPQLEPRNNDDEWNALIGASHT